MDNLIQNFSVTSLEQFFKTKIPSFKPVKENLNHILTDHGFEQFSDLIKIGETDFDGSEDLLVFACKVNDTLSERSAKKRQFEIAKKVLKDNSKDGAIFVFYDTEGNFRFSFIRRNYGEKTDKKFTTWKRYTYLVEPSKTNKTFKERVFEKKFHSLDSIQDAFSVQTLTADFYKELFAWYQWTLSEENGVTFPNNTDTSEDDRVKLEEQIIRLITRLLFVWFIKQKKLVPDNLFKIDKLKTYLNDFDPDSKKEGNYYNAILQNLFFATLNKAIDERAFSKLVKERDIKTLYRYAEMFAISETEILTLFSSVPFLNGGLFECLDRNIKLDGVKYALDGFSKNATKSANGNFKHRAFIPNSVFFDEKKGIISLLERYNFTVEENAPNEIQVALDPELLGNVFENLLGSFNEETKETARKQSGSFYTPREIVSYMVDESLIYYLINAFSELEESTIRQLFTDENLPLAFKNNKTLCEAISRKLKDAKILDPACGSGAFPMGILNRMVEVLEKLACHKEKSIYDLKLHLIEECIYGVDIQTIAAQISKLRFFISLIVEQEEIDLTKPNQNYGVLTLPNLETKFVAANTLIGIKRKQVQGNLFENPAIETTKQELLATRKEHFYAKTANRKKTLREKDAELRERLSNLLKNNNDYAPEDAVQFSHWNPYDQNTSSPFFDVEWMFGLKSKNKETGCFDVVIGNPPYVYTRDVDFGLDFKNYVNKNYFNEISLPNRSKATQSGKINLFALFILKGKKLINNNGNLIYIIPNNILRGTTYDTIRYDLLTKNLINSVVDLGAGIFNKVTASTILLQISNKNLSKNPPTKIFTNVKSLETNNFDYKEVNQIDFLENTSYTFNIMLDKKQISLSNKIKNGSSAFGEFCIDIIEGIVAHKHLIASTHDVNRFELIEGKDIKRFKLQNASNFIEWDKSKIHRTRPDYLWQETKKIIMQRISGGNMPLVAVLDINLNRTFASVNNIVLKQAFKPYYEYFTCLLNSKIINWFYANNFSNNSTLTVNISKTFLETLPIKMIKVNTIAAINKIHENLVNSIDSEFTNNYNVINTFFYKIYELTHEEVLIIDAAFPLSQSEYDNFNIKDL